MTVSEQRSLIDVWYIFIQWIRNQGEIIETTRKKHSHDQFRLDLVREPSHRQSGFMEAAQIFVPEKVDSFFKWCNKKFRAHAGYRLQFDQGDALIPLTVCISQKETHLIKFGGTIINTIVGAISTMDDKVPMPEPTGGGIFADADVLELQQGVEISVFLYDNIGRIYLREFFEKVKKRWPDTQVEKGKWIAKPSLSNEKENAMIGKAPPGRRVDKVADEAYLMIRQGDNTDESRALAFQFWCTEKERDKYDPNSKGAFRKAMKRAENRFLEKTKEGTQ
ncbi:MAG: hypothetical protein AAF614_28550 [Chloroflexota bacterium]